MEDPGVASRALDPAPDGLRLLVIGIGGPGDSDRAESALVQVRGDLAHDLLAHAVAFHAAVAIDVLRRRRDDVRRVAGDDVERLVAHRLEPRPNAPVDVRRAVEVAVELRELDRARVHVAADHVLDVRPHEDRLDAVARAEVEAALHWGADGEARERHRRAMHTGYVVVRRFLPRDQPQVRRDDELVVRHEPHERAHDIAVATHDAHLLSCLERERRERLAHEIGRYRDVEDEELDERAERSAVAQPAKVHRDVARAREDLVLRAERRADRLTGERRTIEHLAQRRDRLRVVGARRRLDRRPCRHAEGL